MGAFDDIRLEWAGQEYVIKSDRVLRALASVEDIVTMSELQRFYQRGTAPLAKIAMAYGALLRYAGAKVADDDVALGMNQSNTDQIMSAIMALLMMMIPKKPQRGASSKEQATGNASPTTTASSKRRSK